MGGSGWYGGMGGEKGHDMGETKVKRVKQHD